MGSHYFSLVALAYTSIKAVRGTKNASTKQRGIIRKRFGPPGLAYFAQFGSHYGAKSHRIKLLGLVVQYKFLFNFPEDISSKIDSIAVIFFQLTNSLVHYNVKNIGYTDAISQK